MQTRTKWSVVGGAVVLLAAAGTGAGVATARSGDSDTPITGPALERASSVALEETGGGKVTGSEIGDEEGYYEIEVTRPDGTQVDVHLTRDFTVIGSESDGPGGDDEGGHDDGADDGSGDR